MQGDPAVLGPAREIDLAEWDVVWLRQDPPFDMHYITSTHLLDRLKGQALVVNDPFWVRNYPRSCWCSTSAADPATTDPPRDLATIPQVQDKHGDIILNRSTAMAAPGCSGWMPMTATSVRCTSCSPGSAASR